MTNKRKQPKKVEPKSVKFSEITKKNQLQENALVKITGGGGNIRTWWP